jgi:hypothetical protein
MSTDAPATGNSTTPIATPVAIPDDPVLLKPINHELLALVSKLQQQNESLQHQLEQLRRRLYGHSNASSRGKASNLLAPPCATG